MMLKKQRDGVRRRSCDALVAGSSGGAPAARAPARRGPRRRKGQVEGGGWASRRGNYLRRGVAATRRSPRRAFALLLPVFVALGVLLSVGARAADGAKGYDAYKVVRTRNIFDPNRKPVRIEAPRPSAPARPRSSTFTLTGTMVREGKSLAFFSGSRSEFSKVISVGDSVANFKITAIEPAQVELEHEGKKMTLAIGKPFQIEGKPGDPEPPEETTPPADGAGTPPAPDAAAAPPASTPPASVTGNSKDEILRRMMERRAKEIGK